MTDKIKIPNDELRVGFESALKQAGHAMAAEIPMLIGNPETQTIFANVEKTLVFVHTAGNEPGGLTTIPVSNIPRNKLLYDQPILVKTTPYGTLRFVALDDSLDVIYSQGIDTSHDATPVWVNQIRWGTIQPVGDMSVLITSATYNNVRVPDILTDAFDGTAIDTDSNPISPPSTNNRVIFVLIQINNITKESSYKQSSEYNASVSFENAIDNELVPTVDTDLHQLGFIRLISGMERIGYGDIYNTPPWIGNSNSEWEVILSANKTLKANKQIVLDEITVPSGITLIVESTARMLVV